MDFCECEGLSGTSASQEGFLEEENLEFKRKGNVGQRLLCLIQWLAVLQAETMSPFYKCLDNLEHPFWDFHHIIMGYVSKRAECSGAT